MADGPGLPASITTPARGVALTPWRRLAAGSWPALRGGAASLVSGAVALALVIRMSWQSGGYFAPSYLWAGATCFVTLALVLLAFPPRYRLSTHALVGLGMLAALAAWTGVSAAWSSAPDVAVQAMQRDMAYVGLFALGLVSAGSGRFGRRLVWAVLGAIVVIVGAGLLSRLYPDLVSDQLAGAALSNYRLGYPLGYWNSFGALAAAGAVLALGLAADPRSAAVQRGAAGAVTVVLFTSMYLSLSRGAFLAFAVGLLVLVALAANRGSLLLTAAVVGSGCTLAAVLLQSYPALTDAPGRGTGQLAQGHSYGPQLVLLALAVAALVGLIGAGRSSPIFMGNLRRVLRPVLIVGGGGLVLVAIVGYAARSSSIEGWTTDSMNSTGSFVSRQWRDFLRPASFSQGGTARLTSARGTRSDLYSVAWRGFTSHPLRGDGAGTYRYRWIAERSVDEKVNNAHSLELETLSDLGLVGGLLLAGFLASLFTAAVRSRLRPGALGRSQTAAVGGACAVWVAHSAIDWDWQMSAVTGIVLILSASLYPYGRRNRRRSGA